MRSEYIKTMRKAAYEAAVYAENAWESELERLFGDAAGIARYDGRAKSTPMLKALYDAKNHATKAWEILGKIERQEIAA